MKASIMQGTPSENQTIFNNHKPAALQFNCNFVLEKFESILFLGEVQGRYIILEHPHFYCWLTYK